MYNQQQQYHLRCLTFNKVVMIMLLVLISLLVLINTSGSTVMGETSTGSGTLREWLSDLNGQANTLQSTSQMLEKAINVLNSSTEISIKDKSTIVGKRTSQYEKINQALYLVNLEIQVIGSKCNQVEGPNCDGVSGAAGCKSGWNGTDCSIPICDSKCLNCSSPGQCSLCYGNFSGSTCSTCKTGYTGSDCNTDMIGEIASSSVLASAMFRNRFFSDIMNGVPLQSGSPKLLFRASANNFLASAFHTKCNNKGPTIVLVKSTSGAIFGGYTSVSWTSSGNDVSDPAAFLFSIVSPTGADRFTKLTQENGAAYKSGQVYGTAVRHQSTRGPVFGGNHDLKIGDNANASATSSSDLCYAYCDTSMKSGTTTANAYLAGVDPVSSSYDFKVSEYEVYTF